MSGALENNENYPPAPRRADSIKTASSQGLGTAIKPSTKVAINVVTTTTHVPSNDSQSSSSTMPLLARTDSIPALQDTSDIATKIGRPSNGDAAGTPGASSSNSSELVEIKMDPRASPKPHENTVVPLDQEEALRQALLAARRQARRTSRDDQFLPDAQATGELSPPEFDNVDRSAQEARAQNEWENQQAETRTSISNEVAQSQARHSDSATAAPQAEVAMGWRGPTYADVVRGDLETEKEMQKKRQEQWEKEAKSNVVKFYDQARRWSEGKRLPGDPETAGSIAPDEEWDVDF